MAMNVTLVKQTRTDGLHRLGNFASLTAQRNYFDGLTDKKSFNGIKTVPLGGPLRVHASIPDLMEYNYGWIDYGDGKRYYFSVADLSFVSETMTEIMYAIDALETARYQYDVSIERANVYRYDGSLSLKRVIPTVGYGKGGKRVENNTTKDETRLCVFFIYRDSESNDVIHGVYQCALSMQRLKEVVNGQWLSKCIDNPVDSNLWNACVMLGRVDLHSFSTNGWMATQKGGDDWAYYRAQIDMDGSHGLVPEMELTTFVKGPIQSTDTDTYMIKDLKGSPLFECEPFVPYYLSGTYDCPIAVVHYTVASIWITVDMAWEGSASSGTGATTLTIPCYNIDYFSDSWNEYYYRMRQSDIDTRNMQMNSNLINGLFNTGQGAVGGAVSGAMAGSVIPGIGTAIGAGIGAVLGAGSSLVSSLGSYAMSAYQSPKEQNIIDTQYKRANDNLQLSGSSDISDWFDFGLTGVWKLTMDSESKNAYLNDVDSFGYYVNDVVTNLDISDCDKITADVEVVGNIPNSWKEQIAYRFANGLVIS